MNLNRAVEHEEIVHRLETMLSLAVPSEAWLAQARVSAFDIQPSAFAWPSLLARAFAGQLVPQDPTEDPASTLLERIKIQKQNCHDSYS